MNFETIAYDKEDGIAIITLSNPERGNALSNQLIKELGKAVDDIEEDENVRVMILTGGPDAKGRPCFSAGGDMKDFSTPGFDMRLFLLQCNALINRIEELEKVTIAAIDGICTAGGLELAMALDIRLVAETVRIGDLHLKNLGSGLGGAGASTRLPRIVGLSNAKMLVFTGDLVDGKEAFRIGLANKVCPPDRLLETAKEIAKKAAAMRPTGVKITKAHLNLGIQMDSYQALHYADVITQLADAEGMKEIRKRQNAFASKGKDAFKNKG
ncbi:MAG: enoyl-CoA hydratase/isomerase family protein [Thermodesulfobacteriota bacterium]|nr:enoyl-CoA hydratase/isomerase family protein [Thermodesulfobacteriota bacterium]